MLMRLSLPQKPLLTEWLLYFGALGRNRTDIEPLGRARSDPLNYESGYQI